MGNHLAVVSDLLAALMLAVAVYCVGRLVLSLRSRRSTQRESDVIHSVMGVSMAGMLTPSLAAVPTGLWVLVFSASTLWFGWRAVAEADREVVGGHALGQHLPHLLMSAAMVYMLVVVEWTGSMAASHGGSMAGMPGMAGMSGGSAARWPLLTIGLAIVLLGDGALSFGVNLRQLMARPDGAVTMVGTDGSGRRSGETAVRLDVRPSPATTAVVAPHSVMVCQLVMSLVMGYMLFSLL
jgi:Domain of unknown function (DUF5134)